MQARQARQPNYPGPARRLDGTVEANTRNMATHPSAPLFFWIKYSLLVLLGCFFLWFGIEILISAYQLEDPFTFMMTFFASNFIILISAALLLAFIVKMRAYYKNRSGLNP